MRTIVVDYVLAVVPPRLSALVNDTTSSQTAAQSLNGRLSTLEERVESLLRQVSSLPQQ